MFRVTVLGSSAAMPSRERALPSIAVEREGELFIFDCGEGTQRQLINAKLAKYQPDVILISHIHGDHVLGIFGLLLSMSLHDRRDPVTIIGPKEVKELVEFVLSKLNSKLFYDVEFREVKRGIVLKTDEYTIRAVKASHQGDSYSYRLDEKERPGKFYPEKAKALGIPMGPLWQKLQHGKSIVIQEQRKDCANSSKVLIFFYSTARIVMNTLMKQEGSDIQPHQRLQNLHLRQTPDC